MGPRKQWIRSKYRSQNSQCLLGNQRKDGEEYWGHMDYDLVWVLVTSASLPGGRGLEAEMIQHLRSV